MKNKFKSKIIRLLSFALVFNLGFGVAILSSNCAKKNDLSYILDPETGKKYFFVFFLKIRKRDILFGSI